MKRNFKLMILTLLCTLSFTLASCAKTALPTPNGGNTTEQPDNNNQGDTGNNNQDGNTQKPDGNTDQGGSQGQTEEKPVKQSIYDSAKALGYTGTEADWNKEYEMHKNQTPTITFDSHFYASIGSGKPDSTIDSEVDTYFDKTTNKIYLKSYEDGSFLDKQEEVQQNTSGKVTIAIYVCNYLLFNDGTIRLSTVFCLSNGYTLGIAQDINIKDVKLNVNKISVDEPDFNNKLNLVVTLENLEKFEIPVSDSRIVISNTVRPTVGTYEVHAKVNNKEYNFSVKVSN